MIQDIFTDRTQSVCGCVVFPDHDPQGQNVFPNVVYSVVSQIGTQGLSERFDYDEVRMQASVLGLSIRDVETLAEKVIAAWQGFTGDFADIQINGCDLLTEDENDYSIEADLTPKRTVFWTHFDLVFIVTTTR